MKTLKERSIKKITHPQGGQGFLGQGHLAVPLFQGISFDESDPFIMLMDDQLDLPGDKSVGGAHPHAGFETVTLVLKGDADTHSKTLQTGGLEWMTAGKGIVHTEEIRSKVKMRILQLWLTLPPEKRWTEPKWQELTMENTPFMKTNAAEIRVYSGESNGMKAPTLNETPAIIVDFRLEGNAVAEQILPSSYTAFIYVVEGAVNVSGSLLENGAVAWLNKDDSANMSLVKFAASDKGARFILYAGEPQKVPLVSHGPFIGDSNEDIVRLYKEYRMGMMPHVRDLPAGSKHYHR